METADGKRLLGILTPTSRDTSREAVTLLVSVQTGATLPKVIEAMIRIARKNECLVSSTWNNTLPLVVSPDDTYQGVQRRVQKMRAAPKVKP